MAKLSSDKTYVTVEWGDTLSQIAVDYKKYTNNATYQTLAKNNDIDNPNLIFVGQKILLKGATKSTNTTSKATIKHFGLQTNTQRTVFAVWTWTKAQTESYQVKWEYDTGNGIWFVGTNSTVNADQGKQSLYDAPTNAKRVRFTVKPISKKRTVNNKETSYWTAGWSTSKLYSFSDNPPEVPKNLSMKIEGLKLTAELNNITGNASIIQFALYKDDVKANTGKAAVKASHAAYEFKLTAGSKYKVQCRAYYDGDYSDWTEFTTPEGTIPETPEKFTKCILKGDDNNQVYLEWKKCKTATSYEIQAAADSALFGNIDASNDVKKFEVKSDTDPSNPPTSYTITSLDMGSEWFLRICAKNEKGQSEWSEVSSTKIGEAPAAPTTWSSTDSVIIGEPLTLYWVHNSEDGSSQTQAELDIVVEENDIVIDDPENITITNSTDEDEKDKTSYYDIPTIRTTNYKVEIFENIYVQTKETVTPAYISDVGINTDTGYPVYSGKTTDGEIIFYCTITEPIYPEGATITWRVKTMGEGSDQYSDWSVSRVIHIYARPTVSIKITDEDGGYITEYNPDDIIEPADNDAILTKFPFLLEAYTGPDSQNPLDYHISVTALESYTTVDLVGNDKSVVAGDTVYSKHIESNDQILVTFDPGMIDLENNISYRIAVLAYMNSGLTAEGYVEFRVEWEDVPVMYEPSAEIMIDEENYTANIRPYCEDTDGNLVDGLTLALYRREFDGSFTEIASGLPNEENRFVPDPHPALDYARYRVVATSNSTGSVIYSDVPGHPVNCKAAIIQWDEAWSSFDTEGNSDALVEPTYTGSILKILYNIDVSEKNKPDVELVSYIGRRNPVSYYGTYVGDTQSWNFVIPSTDKETLYTLRRLKSWMGDVYVREPSGTGYWAHVTVTIPQKHCEVTIAVSIEVTRVEGGI